MATLASTESTPKKVSKANTEGCKICGTVTLANGMGEDNADNIIRSYPVYRSINERFGQLLQPLPHRQLFPFYRVFQPPLLPLPTQFMNLRPQPVVKRLSVLTEYTTGFTETKEIAASRQSIALTLAKGSDESHGKRCCQKILHRKYFE